MTIDVEDWFQVENFKGSIPFSSWQSMELRVEANTHKLLDLLDDFDFQPKATFFVLGWIARKVPWLVKEIQKRGHEVASHGNHHHLCTHQTVDALLEDLKASRCLLEDFTGTTVRGYRAPSFAINNDILSIITEAGYGYDSSYNSFAMHGRYGALDLGRAAKTGSAYVFDTGLFELPVSNLSMGNSVLPLGGGGYFRLLPFWIFKQGIKTVLKNEEAFVFYAHPWEFDPGQPRVNRAPCSFKFRHYVNLDTTLVKLHRMISEFSDSAFVTVSAYIGRYSNRSAHPSGVTVHAG